MIDTQMLIQKLDTLYGKGNGARVCMTILPGILSDFRKMLESAVPGTAVTEEYRLEDGKGTLFLSGMRKADGTADINVKTG